MFHFIHVHMHDEINLGQKKMINEYNILICLFIN